MIDGDATRHFDSYLISVSDLQVVASNSIKKLAVFTSAKTSPAGGRQRSGRLPEICGRLPEIRGRDQCFSMISQPSKPGTCKNQCFSMISQPKVG